MARFVLSNRLAFRDPKRREASGAALEAVSDRLGDRFNVLASEPRGESSRRVVYVDAEPADLQALSASWHEDVIAEPVVPRYPMAWTASLLHSDAVGCLAATAGPGQGAQFKVSFKGDRQPIENASALVVFIAKDGSGRTTSVSATTDARGVAGCDYDPNQWAPAQISVLPRASYWGWVVANPANDQVVEIPALPKDGPLGWWAKAVGVTTYDPRRGAGTRIGVVDTGVGPHPYLSHVEGVGSQVNGVFTAGRKAALDVDEHGTHVSGILAARPVDESRDFAGLAPGASVFVVRVFPEGGGASQGDIAEAIDLLSVQHEVDLINLSLGSPSPSEIERDAIAHAAERGTLCVAAAGNSFGQPVFYPAAYEIVASVAAIGITGSCPNGSVASRSYPPLSPQGIAGNAYVANFCNAGPSLFCCAPGVGIISTAPARHVAPAPYIDLSGTSMAAPMACAALATQLAADAEYLAMPRNLARAQRASAVLNATLRRLGFPQALGGRGLSQAR